MIINCFHDTVLASWQDIWDSHEPATACLPASSLTTPQHASDLMPPSNSPTYNYLKAPCSFLSQVLCKRCSLNLDFFLPLFMWSMSTYLSWLNGNVASFGKLSIMLLICYCRLYIFLKRLSLGWKHNKLIHPCFLFPWYLGLSPSIL